MKVRKITVIGSGAMGAGIAQVCARAGYQVSIYDLDSAQLEKAASNIAMFIRRGAEKGEYSLHEAEQAVSRVRTCTDFAEAVAGCDLAIEAVFEDMDIKKALFRQLGAACSPKAILASNTSSLSIGEMAAACGRPEKVVGMHFFNPAPVMRLVEVIVGAETSSDTAETAVEVVKSFGKSPAVVQDSPNFIVNRISRPLYYEAELMVTEGVPAQDVDLAVRMGAGMRMGPLELLDLVGIGPHLATSETAFREWGDPRYRPIQIVRKMVRAGHVGRRAGKGFYLYPDEKQTPRVPSAICDAEPFETKAMAVIGEGMTASTLAERLGAAGYDVSLYEDLPEGLQNLDGVQMVVEAVENTDRELAKRLFERLGTVCPPSTVFVSTSPVFSPSELGVASGRPDLTIGLHEPMPFMRRGFFEIGKGLDTSDQTVATVCALVRQLNCASVVMGESPCYIVYRTVIPMINEAAFALFEGLASAEDIDVAMKLGLNHPLGPLEWGDKLGIDKVLNIMQTLQHDFGDPRYRPCILIKQMVRAGHLGEKTGRGFYRY